MSDHQVSSQTPNTWTKLKALDLQILTDPLVRDPEVQEEYIQRRSSPTFQTELIEMLKSGLEQRGGIWLRNNDYPYLTESSVEHRVLWFTEDTEDMTLIKAKDWVSTCLNIPKSRIVVCCNAFLLKTVPELNHYHVFILHSTA